MSRTFMLNILFHLLVSGVLPLSSGCSQVTPPPPPEQPKVRGTPALLATLPAAATSVTANEPPNHGEKPTGQGATSKVPAAEQPVVIVMNRYGNGVAHIEALGDQKRVVHNGLPGRLYRDVESNQVTVSPDGKRVAYPAKNGTSWHAVVDDREVGRSEESGALAFSDDSRHVAYELKQGEKWYLYLDGMRSAGAVGYYDKAIFVRNSSRILYIENTSRVGANIFRLVVSDLNFKKPVYKNIMSPGLVTVNRDKTMVAAVEKANAQQRVITFTFDQPSNVTYSRPYDDILSITVSGDGKNLLFLGKRGGRSYLVLNGSEEEVPAGAFPWPPVLRPDGKGGGIVMAVDKGALVHQVFTRDGVRDGLYKECADLVYSPDGSSHAYVAIKDEKFLVVVSGKEGPSFDRVKSPVFSPDGKYLVYLARTGEKRFVVVADRTGTILRRHPGYERVFDTVFTEDGGSVAYGVKEGTSIRWVVEPLAPAPAEGRAG